MVVSNGRMRLKMEVRELKAAIRAEAHARRNDLADKDELSRRILANLTSLSKYESALALAFYIDARSEVRTRSAIATALNSGKRVAVPYCLGDELEVFHLEDLDELAAGRFGILEPREDLRVPEKRVDALDVDFVVVPGVAFDRNGGRLGNGRGYYDRFLRRCATHSTFAGLAYEIQLFAEVPMEPFDVRMNCVVTESTVYCAPKARSEIEA